MRQSSPSTRSRSAPTITLATTLAIVFACVALVAAPIARLAAQDERATVPTPQLLAAITERGRALAGYDVAAWHASDEVMALRPAEGSLTGYVAHRGPAGWIVSFGRLAPARDAWLEAYEATEGASPTTFTVTTHEPALRREGFEAAAARAIDLARQHFGPRTRPYNAAVLPAPDGRLWVYLLPAQTVNGVYPHGGDARYLVSGDGARLVETRRMHRDILESLLPPGAVAGLHTAVLDDVPEDSDVFLVLARSPAMPEIVATDHFTYEIATDGSIRSCRRAPGSPATPCAPGGQLR